MPDRRHLWRGIHDAGMVRSGLEIAVRADGLATAPATSKGLRLRVTITVQPDEFYTRFFEAMLAGGAENGETQIMEALEATRRSAYTLYEADLPLS